MSNLLLENARVVLPETTIERGFLSIKAGRIGSIGDERSLTAGDALDLSGLTLLPGFIDVHIHGSCGYDVMDATPAQLREIARYLASQGVTGWLPTFVPAADEQYAGAVRSIREAGDDA